MGPTIVMGYTSLVTMTRMTNLSMTTRCIVDDVHILCHVDKVHGLDHDDDVHMPRSIFPGEYKNTPGGRIMSLACY